MKVLIPIVLVAIMSFATVVNAQETTGSDNQQNGDLNTNTQNSTVNSNNSTTDTSRTTNNYGAGAGGAQPVMSAVAPTLMSTGPDTCLRSTTGGLQLVQVGASTGTYVQDEECNRRRDTKLFNDLGMKLPAISRMCQNIDNWKAMFVAGSPCPILVNGKMVFGKKAIVLMKQNPELYIPDYLAVTREGDGPFGLPWSKYKKKYYDQILGIGEYANVQSNEDADSDMSISQRFRTSTRD